MRISSNLDKLGSLTEILYVLHEERPIVPDIGRRHFLRVVNCDRNGDLKVKIDVLQQSEYSHQFFIDTLDRSHFSSSAATSDGATQAGSCFGSTGPVLAVEK